MKKICIAMLVFVLYGQACQSPIDTELDDGLTEAIERVSRTGYADYFILADSEDHESLPNQDPDNPITKEKVKLGQMLFFETGLAQNPIYDNCYETYSCATCHVPAAGFLPGRAQGIGDGAVGFGINGDTRIMQNGYEENELDAQGTRPLSSLNVTYMTNTLWSGLFGANGVNKGTEANWIGLAEVNHTGYIGLEAQNIEGFDLHRLAINDHVLDDYGYRTMFDAAFQDFPLEERYSPTTASFAISAYVRTLITNKAPFQDWLKGDYNALTVDQKEGALLFFGKGQCYYCHNGPSFSSMNFHALGTRDMYEFGGLNTSEDDPRNLGRGMFTGEESDMYRFKVPQLYNLKDYVTFFHGSSKTSVREVVEFKVKAESENPHVTADMLSSIFRPVDLTEEEKTQLVDFLENALHDKDVERYMPESILSGNCFPNNDTVSRENLGCN